MSMNAPQRPWIIHPTISFDKIGSRVAPHGEGPPPSRGARIAGRAVLVIVILVVLAIVVSVVAYFARSGADTERALLPETTVIDGATMYGYDVHKGGLFGPNAVGGDSAWVLARFSVEDDAAAQASLRSWLSEGSWRLDSQSPDANAYPWAGGDARYLDPVSSRTLYVNWYDDSDEVSLDLWVGLIEG